MTAGVALNAADAPNQVDATVQLAREAAESGLAPVDRYRHGRLPRRAAHGRHPRPGAATGRGERRAAAGRRDGAAGAAGQRRPEDGIPPYLVGPRALADHIVSALHAAAGAAGRPAPRVVALAPGVVTDDVAAVRARFTENLAFYEHIPSYARVIELSGGRRAADLAVVGDEKTVEAEVRRYRDAGATEVVFSSTEIAGAGNRRRTWRLLGELTH